MENDIKNILENLFEKLKVELIGDNYLLYSQAQNDLEQAFKNDDNDDMHITDCNCPCGACEECDYA